MIRLNNKLVRSDPLQVVENKCFDKQNALAYLNRQIIKMLFLPLHQKIIIFDISQCLACACE